MTPKNQRSHKSPYHAGGAGVHLNTLESNPLDVVYSDPKDSKLYQVPGADPRPEAEDVLYKVYVSGREAQYCRPYVAMRSSVQHKTGMQYFFLT